MNQDIRKKIITYSKKYYNDFLKLLEVKKDSLLENPKEALNFFLDRVFYQGRQDRISEKVRDQVKLAIEEFEKAKGDFNALFGIQNHGDLRQILFSRIGRGKVGRGSDIDLMISLLEFAAQVKGNNLISYLKENFQRGKVVYLFQTLQKIKRIGPKISSFILRDFSVLFGLDEGLDIDDYVALQPVDTWVMKVGHILGLYDLKEINKMSEKKRDEKIRQSIIDYCISQKLSPPRFNQGMWYYGFSERPKVDENSKGLSL